MEHSQKNTDCYFFYYSTCLKGDACAFRHEPSALGCETMCSYWQQGNCLNEHCNFRHMELKKNRKSIACYWETQPGGCRKPHCCFMHKNARGPATAEPINPVRNNDLTAKPVNQEWSNRQDDGKYDSDPRTTLDGSSTESDQGRGGSEAGSFIGSPAVDPLVVNFEEESDNESVPSPTKPKLRMLHVKTLEEIKLERIQAESAAYYNYAQEDIAGPNQMGDRSGILNDAGPGGGGLGATILERNLRARLANRLYTQSGNTKITADPKYNLDFQVLSLDEIRKRRRRISPAAASEDSSSSNKIPRLNENNSSSDYRTIHIDKKLTTDQKNCSIDKETSDVESRPTKNSSTSSTAPPVRLRRGNRTPVELSPRKKILRNFGDLKEQPEVISSDSSQDATVVLDRLSLVASQSSISVRNDRAESVGDKIEEREGNRVKEEKGEELNEDAEMRLHDQNGVQLDEGLLINGDSEITMKTGNSRGVSSSIVSEEDYLMMDATSMDHTAGADDILQDIDDLLGD